MDFIPLPTLHVVGFGSWILELNFCYKIVVKLSRAPELKLKKNIKSILKYLINLPIALMGKSSIGRYLYTQIINNAMGRTKKVEHQGLSLIFSVPNPLNTFRVGTFSTKEPETLEWIDSMPQGSILWDIGANVGLYTCYAAKARGCRVFAFEPSVFNLELLARNIFLNELTDQATIVPLPLSDVLATNTLNMTTTEWGGALSSFGQVYGHDGQALCRIFAFQTIGVSMVDAMTLLGIPQPDYIKMDVDGIEHLILKGGALVLRNVKGVLIEISEGFEKQVVDSTRYLGEAELVLKKRHPSMFKDTLCSNQIWYRENAL